jgi:hypothetical protein
VEGPDSTNEIYAQQESISSGRVGIVINASYYYFIFTNERVASDYFKHCITGAINVPSISAIIGKPIYDTLADTIIGIAEELADKQDELVFNTAYDPTNNKVATMADVSGAGSSYTFTNGLSESSGIVSWDLNDRIAAGTGTGGLILGDVGYNTASGIYANAEGSGTKAQGNLSHAEGSGCWSNNYASHAEGESTRTNADGSHAEGFSSWTYGYYSHAEGVVTYASSYC